MNMCLDKTYTAFLPPVFLTVRAGVELFALFKLPLRYMKQSVATAEQSQADETCVAPPWLTAFCGQAVRRLMK